MTDTKAEKRGYGRGYQAGMKRIDREAADLNSQIKALRRELALNNRDRRDRFFCAALTGLIQDNTWKLLGKRANNAEDYTALAKIFADVAMEKMP